MENSRKIKRNFTLAELMVVLLILGLLAAVGVPAFMSKADKARVKTTAMSAKNLALAIKSYKMDVGTLPDSLEGLIKNPDGNKKWGPDPYMENGKLPKDSWGNDFIYEKDSNSVGGFKVISYGADGQAGGEKYAADISNLDD